MIAYENTILQFKKDMRAKRLGNFMCAEYEAVSGHPVSGEFRYGWKYALGILYAGLESLDAGECIEYVVTVHRKLGELLDQYRC